MSSSTPFKAPPISPIPRDMDAQILKHLGEQTKPPKSLGRLEGLSAQLARIQQTMTPKTSDALHLVFAADHGITASGVSPYPSAVTAQMVDNFLRGGAAINVFCRTNDVRLHIVNAGVNADLPAHPQLLDCSAGKGTDNLRYRPAMTAQQLNFCLQTGADLVSEMAADADIISLGEMGIGNTTTSAALMCALFHWPAEAVVGAGTGASRAMQAQKSQVIREALHLHRKSLVNTLDILRCLGGFEIAMMTGAYLQAGALRKTVVVDGFISTAAWALAQSLQPNLREYSIFAHLSSERGHRKLIQQLSVKPLLDLDMCLGEGTGAIAALPLVRLAGQTMADMATFSGAGVSQATQ